MDNDTKKIDESPIGIGEIPLAESSRIRPHIRHNDKIAQISEEFIPEIEREKSKAPSVDEGENPIDVYETADYIYIITPIAGTKLEDIELTITEDVINIRGVRTLGKEIPPQNYLVRECFWGRFSRSIILPPDADPQNISAKEKNSVLTIKIGKHDSSKTRTIEIK